MEKKRNAKRVMENLKERHHLKVLGEDGRIWAEHAAGMEKKQNAKSVMVGKPKRKTPLESSWRRWEDNVKIDRQ
jgi:hypothetical protein